MPSTLSDLLNLNLAWRRVRHEIAEGRCFGIHPHELRLIKLTEDSWLAALADDLLAGRYEPGSLDICQAPKPQGAIRPGGRLSLKDHVIYTACVGFYSAKIRRALMWHDRPRDFSHPIAADPNSVTWLSNPFGGWKQFGTASLIRIEQGATHVAITDIAGFYENIDIALMLSDLRGIDDNGPVAQLLSKCLNKWSLSQVSGRGLPQGFAASDILARLYLHAVDHSLSDRGIFHYRYVDDFRLFSGSLPDARQALMTLIVVLRKRGLVLQTAKSDIHMADEARLEIEGIQPVLRTALQGYVHDIAELFGVTDPYFTLWDAEQLVAADPNSAPIEIMRSTYSEHIEAADPRTFDKTLFHFLLKRFGNANDPFAFPHCLTLLVNQAQETEAILRYITAIGKRDEADSVLTRFLESAENVYWYQTHQIVAWRTAASGSPSAPFVSYVRHLVFASGAPGYARSTGREFIARYGTLADVDRLEESLSEAALDLERAELVCSIRRMESGRRNSILARLRDESMFTTNAVNLVRTNALE